MWKGFDIQSHVNWLYSSWGISQLQLQSALKGLQHSGAHANFRKGTALKSLVRLTVSLKKHTFTDRNILHWGNLYIAKPMGESSCKWM